MRQALDNFDKFLHGEHPMPALIEVGIPHSQLEPIHPILDGSGRAARLLITFLLSEKEIVKRPQLYSSPHFKLNRCTATIGLRPWAIATTANAG